MPSPSAYYPPRAGVLRPARGAWYWLRRTLHLENFTPKPGASRLSRQALQLLIPGLVCFERRQTTVGGILLGLWVAAFALYWSEIGQTLSTLAFLLMTSVHSLSATMALRASIDNVTHPNRAAILASILVFTFYTVFRMEISDRIVQPIRVRNDRWRLRLYGAQSALPDQVVLINPAAGAYHRGDWVLYSVTGAGGISMRGSGLSLDRILALPGETVEFHPDSFEVEGVKYAKVGQGMPSAGSQKIPSGAYFIWPTSVTVPNARAEENAPAPTSPEVANRAVLTRTAGGHALSYAALASMAWAETIVGKPYHRWFFHSRNLPPLIMLPSSLSAKSP